MSLTIREAIKEIIKDENELYSLICNIDEVDETVRTIKATPIDGGASIFDVRLQSSLEGEKGFVIIPVVDSKCIVTFTSKDTAFASLFEEIDKTILVVGTSIEIECDDIKFNGGDNGSLIIIQALIDVVNNLENKHNSLVKDLNSRTFVTTATIGPTAVLGIITASPLTGLDISPTTKVSDIENKKIQH